VKQLEAAPRCPFHAPLLTCQAIPFCPSPIDTGLPFCTTSVRCRPVRWLVHGKLTPAVAEALKRHGDAAQDLSSLSLAPGTSPAEVLKVAQKAQLDLMTDDALMVETLFAEDAPPFNRSVVYLHLEGGDVEQDDAVDRLFTRYKRLTPGRMYTVTGSRVKVRQLAAR